MYFPEYDIRIAPDDVERVRRRDPKFGRKALSEKYQAGPKAKLTSFGLNGARRVILTIRGIPGGTESPDALPSSDPAAGTDPVIGEHPVREWAEEGDVGTLRFVTTIPITRTRFLTGPRSMQPGGRSSASA